MWFITSAACWSLAPPLAVYIYVRERLRRDAASQHERTYLMFQQSAETKNAISHMDGAASLALYPTLLAAPIELASRQRESAACQNFRAHNISVWSSVGPFPLWSVCVRSTFDLFRIWSSNLIMHREQKGSARSDMAEPLLYLFLIEIQFS